MSIFAGHAAALAERGYRVFPVRPRGKAPLTANGWKDATADERAILHWADRWPDANIGVACGPSGLAVLDIDSKHGADPDDVFGRLDLPAAAVVVRTGEAPERSAEFPDSLPGTRGAQVFFRGAMPTIGRLKIPGAEVRAAGAYVVVPPSVHPSGVRYEGELPPVSALPAVPDWLRALVTANGNGRATPIGGPIGQGERHQTLLSLGGSMRRRGLPGPVILAALRATNGDLCRPPLSDDEVRRMARDAAKYQPAAFPAAEHRQPPDVPPQTLPDVLATFQRWLYLPDPGVVHVVLGAIAANLLDGDPVWLVLVGAPGSGKSETLQAAGSLPDVHPAATLTEAALLSGTSRRETASDAKGGLLRAVGDFGFILAKDFGSVLNMQRDARAAVLAALREIYDGSWTRHVGTDGGRTLSWSGKVGLLTGSTQSIDRHHAVMGAMGERFVLYRLPGTDADEQAQRALQNAGRETAMRAELAAAVAGLFRDGLPVPDPPELTDDERTRLVALATLAVRCRSAVERDGYTREVELVPDPESPGRLVKVLGRLVAGVRAIGADDATAWHVVTKCALDSVPALRLAAIDHLYRVTGEQPTPAIAQALAHPTQTARRALEDLAAHGILHRTSNGQGKADTWSLSDWAAIRYRAALTVPETSGGPCDA